LAGNEDWVGFIAAELAEDELVGMDSKESRSWSPERLGLSRRVPIKEKKKMKEEKTGEEKEVK
jgi:hypothetical protein